MKRFRLHIGVLLPSVMLLASPPSSGAIAVMSGADTITSGDLSGDVTTTGGDNMTAKAGDA